MPKMQRCCEPWMLLIPSVMKFIPLLPSRTALVLKGVIVKPVNTAVKTVGCVLYYPKTLLITWIQIQFQIATFPFRLVSFVWGWFGSRSESAASTTTAAAEEYSTEPVTSEAISYNHGASTSASTKELSEPRSEDVVKQVKRLRNHVAMSIDIFTGNDLFWDFPILELKAKKFARALVEGDQMKMAETKKALKEHPLYCPRPKSRAEYNRIMEEARKEYALDDIVPNRREENGRLEENIVNTTSKFREAVKEEETDNPKWKRENIRPQLENTVKIEKKNCGITRNGIKDVSNVLNSRMKVELRVDKGETNLKQESVNAEFRHVKQSLPKKRLSSQLLMATNKKLEEMLKLSNDVLQELSNLKVRFNEFSDLGKRIASLESEISEGRKSLHIIEQERDEMRQKLLALEQLIKEEENFLDELSCESGFEETSSDNLEL